MKVFKVNDCDWVCAKDFEEAKNFLIKEYDYDEEDIENKKCDINFEYMWYSFNDMDKLTIFCRNNIGYEYRVKYDRPNGYGVTLWLSFFDVIKLDKIEKPCIIASTEY